MAVVATTAVVVVLVTVGLFALVPNGWRVGTRGPVSLAAARNAAIRVLGPGVWMLEVATGFAPADTTVIPLNSSSSTASPDCTVENTSRVLPSAFVLPAYHGNLSFGLASVWFLTFINPRASIYEAILVVDGFASVLARVSGPNCFLISQALPFLPNDAVDSSVAASSVYSNGGSRFLGAEPKGFTLVMSFYQSSMLQPLATLAQVPESALWEVDYVPCSGLFRANTTGASNGVAFYATVNGTDAAMLGAGSAPADCQSEAFGPPAIFSVLHFGTPELVTGAGTGGTIASQGCTSGDYCYELPVTNASAGVDPADAGFSVVNNSMVLSPVPTGYAILTEAGQVIVYSLASQESSWLPGAGNSTTVWAIGDSLSVDMGTHNPEWQVYGLWMMGGGAYYGSASEISLGLPY